ncbi:hypothetical protein CRI94_14240 [Longibacter salinarum]|uniref:Uncharacterized protein n=1 Tax=Longibacter salinarum TaxID=1850348 RepID=A0A2A8CV83_9BACT|nr:hypothetical protein [Longibacter salinarum]PEN12669.1 hypothetical protein CRI94_14240 [Longibacter salinarum]
MSSQQITAGAIVAVILGAVILAYSNQSSGRAQENDGSAPPSDPAVSSTGTDSGSGRPASLAQTIADTLSRPSSCECRDRYKGADPFMVSFEDVDPVMFCGYVEEVKSPRVMYAGEFGALACRRDTTFIEYGALTRARLDRYSDSVRVTRYRNLPYGPNWEERRVDIEANVLRAQEEKVHMTKRWVFDPPSLTAAEVDSILQRARELSDGGIDTDEVGQAEDMIYILMAAAISHPGKAEQTFLEYRESAPFYGYLGEIHTRASSLYRQHREKASKPASDELPVGRGVLGFEEGFILDFERGDSLSFGLHADTADATPDRLLTVYWEEKITAPYIRDLKSAWLVPEVDAFTYEKFYLRVVDRTQTWSKVIVNNATRKAYWLRHRAPLEFTPWPEFLTDKTLCVSPHSGRQLREEPSPDASVQPYKLSDSTCLVALEAQGEWLRVQKQRVCGSEWGKAQGDPAWIRWQKDGTLRATYSLTC